MLTRHRVKPPRGMKFYPDQRYLARPNTEGTYDIFPYTEALAARPDMEEFEPFSKAAEGEVQGRGLKRDPELSALTRDVTREAVRAELAKCTSRQQKLFYTLSLLWKKAKDNDILIESFEPRYRDITSLMGAIFTRDQLRTAISKFKANPDDLKTLMAEAFDDPADLQTAIFPEGHLTAKGNLAITPETTEETINDFSRNIKPGSNPVRRHEGTIPMERSGADSLDE